MNVLSTSIEIACSITIFSEGEGNWVARNGPESIFAAVVKILPQVCKQLFAAEIDRSLILVGLF